MEGPPRSGRERCYCPRTLPARTGDAVPPRLTSTAPTGGAGRMPSLFLSGDGLVPAGSTEPARGRAVAFLPAAVPGWAGRWRGGQGTSGSEGWATGGVVGPFSL